MMIFIKILILDFIEKTLLLYSNLRISKPKIYFSKEYFNENIKRYLKPGDIIVMSEAGYLSNYLIPGEYNHAGIYVCDNCMVHAYYPTVKKEGLYSVLKYKNKFEILRHVQMRSSPNGEKIAHLAKEQIGVAYDMNFYREQNARPRFYCSELCFWLFQKLNIKVNIESEYILPDDLANSSDFITVFKGVYK